MKTKHIRADDDVSRVLSFVHVLRTFEIEFLCLLKDWDTITQTIAVRCRIRYLFISLTYSCYQETIRSDALAVLTFEAIADILVCASGCSPVCAVYSLHSRYSGPRRTVRWMVSDTVSFDKVPLTAPSVLFAALEVNKFL